MSDRRPQQQGRDRGNRERSYPRAWLAAIVFFLVAGATGFLFRAGMLTSLPAGLNYGNVRHAHSHLMYFGWVTPALMLLVAHRLSSDAIRRTAEATLVLAGLSYVPFLLYGYSTAPIGGTRLPLSVIFATLNMLAWYVFAVLYVRHRTHSPPSVRRWWDAAIAFLVLSSLGAWGLGLVQALRPENPFWFQATLHLFLDLFANGWLLLSILGCAVSALRPSDTSRIRWSYRALVVGLPFTFLLSLSVDLVPRPLRWTAAGGAMIAALGLFGVVASLIGAVAIRKKQQTSFVPLISARGWGVPIASVGLVAIAWAGLSIPTVASWALGSGLRILYLHILLLGGITLGLLAAARSAWGACAVPGHPGWTAGVTLLLGSLVPVTGLWPSAWSGPWILQTAAAGAAAPLLAAGATAVLLACAERGDDPGISHPDHASTKTSTG